jgi:hypothetical protein
MRCFGLAYVLLVANGFESTHGFDYLGIEGVLRALLIVVRHGHFEELVHNRLGKELNLTTIVDEFYYILVIQNY